MEIDPRTTASLKVSLFLLTSTILARPVLSKWVSLAILSSQPTHSGFMKFKSAIRNLKSEIDSPSNRRHIPLAFLELVAVNLVSFWF